MTSAARRTVHPAGRRLCMLVLALAAGLSSACTRLPPRVAAELEPEPATSHYGTAREER